MVGQTLSHFKIVEKIGAGGMGEVYLAEDTKLARRVALKILPPELAESDERRARFEREAKAIAALNHPNIVTVHSVEEADGVHFIIMELVTGKTLAELLPSKGFPLETFFRIAVPLADGVAAAHRTGIVHRDLKPTNVMLTEEGRVKILDFGLARTERPIHFDGDSESPTALKTQEGVVAGTLQYMSPEQGEGKAVDPRSDIFSMGIILYELVTGQRPFRGDSPAAVLSSIIKDKPPSVTEVNPELPSLLGRTIRRCLAKDPSRRYQSALDVRNELEELKQDWDSGTLSVAPGLPRAGRVRRSGGLWLGGAIVALVFMAWWSGRFRNSVDEPTDGAIPRLTNPVQVTSAIGLEGEPTWSPDGRAVAYHSNQSGNWHIWISQIDGGQPLNRTDDHAGVDQYPSWSPKGDRIAFVSDRGGGAIFVMPVFAGPAERVSRPGTLARGRPQWSSDGTELAYEIRESERSFAEISSLATGEFRRVELPGTRLKRPHLSWSPSGRFFAYIDADEPINPGVLMVVRVVDGSSVAITGAQTYKRAPSWSDDERALYFTSNQGGEWDLWRQPLAEDAVPRGDPQPVTQGLQAQSAAFSSNGTRLAYSKGRRVANVWRVPILEDRPTTWADAEQMTFDQAWVNNVDVSRDGGRLAFTSDRSGSKRDVWILSLESGELRQLTTDPNLDNAPAWSPDGSQVAFYSDRSGTRDIWVKNVDGGPARQVTRHESEDYFPAWSPDGASIVFASTRSGGVTLWAVPAAGGTSKRIVETPDVNAAQWSPDGEWLAFSSYGAHVPDRIWLMHRSETEPAVLTTGEGIVRWNPQRQEVFFPRRVSEGEGTLVSVQANLWGIDVKTRSERQLTQLSGRYGHLGRFTTDGTYLYFAWDEDVGDIWVMDVVMDESGVP